MLLQACLKEMITGKLMHGTMVNHEVTNVTDAMDML